VGSDTKLIDEARFKLNSPLGKLKLDVDAQAFAYNQDIPSGAFTVPEGMMIIDEAASKEAEALLEKARPLFEAKQYTEAMAQYQQVCDAYPGQYNETANARLMIGHCYRALGQRQKALEAYQEAIDIARAVGTEGITMGWYVATGYLSMGRTYVELGQDAKALEAYAACIQACDGWAGPEQWPHQEALEAIEQLRQP
jgi:tetratricopeptide (TPR) repeat protein